LGDLRRRREEEPAVSEERHREEHLQDPERDVHDLTFLYPDVERVTPESTSDHR